MLERLPIISKRALIAVATGVFALVAVGGLFLFDPDHSAIYPVCLFHKFTGLNCPGCGSLRALHHLTHCDFAAAFHCNPLLIVALAVLPGLFLRLPGWGREAVPRPARWSRPAKAWAICAIVILFGVLRNVPGPAFAWMSP